MSEEFENEFYVLLRSFRERRQKQRTWGMKWDQGAVAKRLGVSRVAYINWDHGQSLPTRIHLKKIVSIFYLDEKEERALYRAAAEVRPDIENLPFTPNPFFTGRKSYLKQLVHLFHESGSVAPKRPIVISISGLAGIGKTQLALAYAYHCYPNPYRAVLWVNADRTTLEASYGSLAKTLDLPEKDEHELERRIEAVMKWLADHTNWLLIMDNADELELARAFIPRSQHGHILFTTRSQFAGEIGALQIELDKMKAAEGRRFLLRRTRVLEDKAKLDTVGESDLQLVKLLDGHPLALDQAGAYIEQTEVSLTEYINLYQKQRRLMLAKRDALEGEHREHPEYSDHPDTVVVTFGLCFAMARERHRLADEILNFCAFLQPDAIPEELFLHDDSFKVDTDTFNGGIAALRRYSLVKRNGQEMTLSMHRLVQAVLIDGMPDLQTQWRDRVARALLATFPEVESGNWGQWERLLPHALVCATWTEDELTPTVDVGSLFYKAGLYLYNRGQSSEAEPLVARALSIYERHFGVEDRVTAIILNHLAVLYMVQVKFSHAEPLYLQALAIQEKQLGAEHPLIARSLTDLSMLYLTQGTYGQAESLIVRALSIREKHLGAENSDTARSLHMLAHLYHTQGKYEQAEPLYRRALEIFEKNPAAARPDTALTLYWLAMLLHKQGQHEQAVAMSQRSLSIQEKQLGLAHPYIQATKKGYADYLHSIGRDAEAAALETNDEPSG